MNRHWQDPSPGRRGWRLGWLEPFTRPRRAGSYRRHPARAARLVPALLAIAALIAAGAVVPIPRSDSVAPTADHRRKVLIVVEENHGYRQIIGNPQAPYLNSLAAAYGSATDYQAGYPVTCPSLAAYLLLTSGSTHGICDDKGPKKHRLAGDNLFHQVTAAGRQWRAYAEAAAGTCALHNQGAYLVRHVPAVYYRDEHADCRRWTVPLGTLQAGALHDDVTAGRLPAFSFVSPDACDDMHGVPGCSTDPVSAGDRWLHRWLPLIMAGPDYRAGRLTVIITWDEGTPTSNHIPTLLIAPTVRHRRASTPLDHCSTLRFTEDLLGLSRLGCAATATSLGQPFGL